MSQPDGELPTRNDLLEALVALRDSGETHRDESGQFIGAEVRVALYALVQGHNALARGELLGGLYYLRLLSETAIRLRWLLGDDDAPAADAETVRTRSRQLRKRDLAQLEAALIAIHAARDESPADELVNGLRVLQEKIKEPAAPWDIAKMALSRAARLVYASHRLCSSLIHPGATLGRRDLIPRERAEAMTDEAAAVCSSCADLALAAVGE